MLATTKPQFKATWMSGTKARRRKTSKEERVCPVCAQAFKKAEHLARHLRSHTKEKPFNCPVCHKAFARQDTLLRHARSHPPDNPALETSDLHDAVPSDELESDYNSPNSMEFAQVALQLNSGSVTEGMMTLMSPPNSIPVETETSGLAFEDTTYPSQMAPLAPLIPLQTDNAWGHHQPVPPPDLWDCQLKNGECERLLTGEDFDLDAVNLSLLYPIPDFVPTADVMSESATIGSSIRPPSNIDTNPPEKLANTIQEKWHTFSEDYSSGQMTPVAPPENNCIDETYRKRLAERLQQRVQHGILPSTSFLDLCIQAYFSKFHPLFPVVHMPTFRPGFHNSVLLLSICSAGSLMIGSPRAISHSISIFERLNKATLSSWDTYAAKSSGSSFVALQASIIGQTFGLMMGRPKDLYGIETFHGSIVAWARKAKLFNLQHPNYDLANAEGRTLEEMWLDWIQIEVKKRIVVGIFIHDAELARIHCHEPILRHSKARLPELSSNALFTSPNAAEWYALMKESQIIPASTYPNKPSAQSHIHKSHLPNEFAMCGMLHSISALSCEERDQRPETELRKASECHNLLINWYKTYQSRITGKPSRLCFMMLWHSVFMNLHADFNALECACGRDGYSVAQNHIPYARQWAQSMDAKRCLLHAMLIQKNFESLPAGAESAMHVPMCLYYCGLVWSCFMLFNEDHKSGPIDISTADRLKFPELSLQGIDGFGSFLEQMDGLQPFRLATGSLFRIIDLLQRISHWKIAQSLASTLSALVDCHFFGFTQFNAPTEREPITTE